MKDQIKGFDFGLRRGAWTTSNTYIAEPLPGIGVLIYDPENYILSSTRGWYLNFFPITQPDAELIDNYADYTVAIARGLREPEWKTFSGLFEPLVIYALIHQTIGDTNVQQ